MTIKMALPKGWIQGRTASLLKRAGFGYGDYNESSRSYRPESKKYPDMFTKVLHEKDIAIQVATGNYDLAICGFDWIQEVLVKYHSDAVVKIRDLGYGQRNLYVSTSKFSELHSVDDLKAMDEPVRIVTEYPNLAEAFALKLRLRNFRVLPVWGATDVYPPEHADLAIVSAADPEELAEKDLIPIAKIISGNVWLIANRNSMEQKDMSSVMAPFYKVNPRVDNEENIAIAEIDSEDEFEPQVYSDDSVSLAVADGHQQKHTSKFMKAAGIEIRGYKTSVPTRRPMMSVDDISVKVIRPQDMPLQVANGNFDLAVTGQDWLVDQLYRFPASPVEELVTLGFGKVRIVAVVHNDVPAENTSDLRALLESGEIPILRIATEYTNIADMYARDNHLSPYKVIPSWGATEAFLPEDADVLIENTETGSTLKKNNLKIVETLFESSGCLIGNSNSLNDPNKQGQINALVDMLEKALPEDR